MKTVVLALLAFVIFSPITFAQSDSAVYYFNKGLEEKRSGRLLPAYQNLQRAIVFSPHSITYHKEAGLIALELRKYDQARQHFESSFILDKQDTLSIIQLAQLNFSLHRWNDAIKYADLMRQKQVGTRYNYMLARSNYEKENYGESYKYFQAASKEEPNNAEIPYLQARSFVDMDNYKTAAQFFDEALALDTSKANWFYEAGLTHLAIPDAQKAVEYLERAIKKGYDASSGDWINISNAYVAAGQPEKGLQVMKDLLQRKPADLGLLWSLAQAHYKLGKYNEAIEYYDRILYYDKSDAEALYMIGMSYQRKGEKAKGEQLCDKAISMDPSLRNLRQKKELPAGF